MKIIFMGTPAFAVPILSALIDSKHDVIAVYSRPPSLANRGQKYVQSPVHSKAEACGITVFTPTSLKPAEEVEALRQLKPDAIVVAAYGLILRPEVLAIPQYGCINIHPSDLPRWRGAAPIQRTILAGDKTSAMCIMKMDAGLDTGEVILRHKFDLDENSTAQMLHDHMAELGATMLISALAEIEAGTAKYQVQTQEGILYAQKLTAEEEKLNFSQSAYMVNCQVRAFSPRPGAYFTYKDEAIKVITAEYTDDDHNSIVGTVVDDQLTIACKHGFLKPTLLQRPGRKMIYTDAFLRGFVIAKGVVLS